jgi:hypothetical protein
MMAHSRGVAPACDSSFGYTFQLVFDIAAGSGLEF